jgi:hypothetical protein
VRRAAGGLGRLAGNAGLLTLVGIASFVAAGADAAPAPALFKVSIVGAAHAEWDHTGVAARFADCERRVRSEAIRDVRFRTAKPTVVRVVGGRLLPGSIRRLTGTVTLAGANTLTDLCGTETREALQDCATTKRSFGGGTVAVSSTRPRSLTPGQPRNIRLRTSDCPREPAEVTRAPLGPIPGAIRASALAKDRIMRITLTASATHTLNYGPVERGTLTERSSWKLTLQRLGR